MVCSKMDELANLIVSYSLAVTPGEKVLIESWDEADDLTGALQEAVLEAGGIPFLDRQNASLQRTFLMHASPDAMCRRADLELVRMREMDGYVAIRKADNCYENSDVPEAQMALWNRVTAELRRERMVHTKWCVLRYPGPSMAQLCHMSTEAFQAYFFSVCCLNYAEMSRKAAALENLMKATDKVRIKAKDTDLTFSIKGCKGGPAFPNDTGCGRLNLPDGEVGGGVVKESVNGRITYNVPSVYNGRTFQQISFTIEKGKIVKAVCNGTESDQLALNAILDTDEGARYFGEFSLGINPMVKKAIGDILFDEKMWGSLHFTPGHAPSAIHWDLVLSQRSEDGGGEIWFDDKLVRRDGLFVLPELMDLNPDRILIKEA